MEFLIQVVFMMFFFYAFWGYAWLVPVCLTVHILTIIIPREHLNSDMRDKELTYWTCRGVKAAGIITIYTVQVSKLL